MESKKLTCIIPFSVWSKALTARYNSFNIDWKTNDWDKSVKRQKEFEIFLKEIGIERLDIRNLRSSDMGYEAIISDEKKFMLFKLKYEF